MLADEHPRWARSLQSIGGSAVFILYFDDVDTVFNRAVAAGAKVLRRCRTNSTATAPAIADPLATLTIATHKEDLSPRRFKRVQRRCTGNKIRSRFIEGVIQTPPEVGGRVDSRFATEGTGRPKALPSPRTLHSWSVLVGFAAQT